MQLALNELDSIMLTNAAKQGDPVAFIKASSGINVFDFQKNKDEPGRAFTYTGNSLNDVVQYLSQPDLPRDISALPTTYIDRIKDNTGVNELYSGEGSGSLQTSGGISQVIQRSGLKDTKVIKNIESYLRTLYLTILSHVKEHGGTARYTKQSHSQEDPSFHEFDLNSIN